MFRCSTSKARFTVDTHTSSFESLAVGFLERTDFENLSMCASVVD